MDLSRKTKKKTYPFLERRTNHFKEWILITTATVNIPEHIVEVVKNGLGSETATENNVRKTLKLNKLLKYYEYTPDIILRA